MGKLLSPKTPPSKPVVAMPDEFDPAVQAAERKKRQGVMNRGGRASTILSSGDQSMGGSGEYTGQNVGGG